MLSEVNNLQSPSLICDSRRRNADFLDVARLILIEEGFAMSLGMILLIVLVVILVGAVPTWPHSRGWGYGPSGLLGTVLIIVLILVLLGKL